MEALHGAVLCGGESRRMGRDKALVEVGGDALAARVARALRDAGATTVTCVGGDLPALAALGLDAVPDDHPGDGPLGGIVTALRHAAASDVVVVLPCDLRAPSPRAIRAVAAALGALDAATPAAVPVVDGRPEWLHAAWRRAALDPLAAAFASGERAIHRAMASIDWSPVAGIEPAAVADIDTADDL